MASPVTSVRNAKQTCEEDQAELQQHRRVAYAVKSTAKSVPPTWTASRFVRQSVAGPSASNVAKAESRADSSRQSFPANDTINVVVDDPMEVEESAQAPQLQVLDPVMPAVPTPNNSRMRLFFVESMVQSTPMWILADSGSSRNLISEVTFNRLAFQPPLRPHGDVRVIGGSGEALHLRGFAVHGHRCAQQLTMTQWCLSHCPLSETL